MKEKEGKKDDYDDNDKSETRKQEERVQQPLRPTIDRLIRNDDLTTTTTTGNNATTAPTVFQKKLLVVSAPCLEHTQLFKRIFLYLWHLAGSSSRRVGRLGPVDAGGVGTSLAQKSNPLSLPPSSIRFFASHQSLTPILPVLVDAHPPPRLDRFGRSFLSRRLNNVCADEAPNDEQ
jgi:hypothetical protein